MLISQELKGVIMRNMCGNIFYMKTNVLQDFHICMSAPLKRINTEAAAHRCSVAVLKNRKQPLGDAFQNRCL